MADVAAAVLSLSAAAVVEDVLRQHGCRLSDRDLASRRAEEAGAVRASSFGLRRFGFLASSGRVAFSEFGFGFGACSGEAERGGGVAAPHGGGGRRARPPGGAVRGGVPPRPPQRPDPLRRAQQSPPWRRPQGKRPRCVR
jgi:hypothetical protein